MGPIDAFIVYKFVRLLTTPFDETDAFKTGVIDGSGKLVADTNHLNADQNKAYTLFNRLVFNIKRLIEKVPGGKSKIGTYAAALYLFSEEMGDTEGQIVMERTFMTYLKENDALDGSYLEEMYKPNEILDQGNYKLVDTMLDTKGDHIPKGTIVVAKKSLHPLSRVLGVDVYQLQVAHSGKLVVVSQDDIVEV